MPILGPDNRLMYYPHEVFDLVGKMKFGTSWKSEYHPADESVEGVRFNYLSEALEISSKDILQHQHANQTHTDDCLSYIEIIMAEGWVVSWLRRNEMWSVYEPTHWQVDHDGDGLSDGRGLRFFTRWVEKVMVEGEEPSPEYLIDKSSFDRTLETIGSDVHGFIKRVIRGKGGVEPTHRVNIWKQLIAEILTTNPGDIEKGDLAKMVVQKLKGTKYPVPSPATVRNYIQFLSENGEI